MKLLDVPQSLSELSVHLQWSVKPDWRGIFAHVVGAIIWLGELVRIRAASSFMDDYTTIISERLYLSRGSKGPPTHATMIHESVHDWQSQRYFAHALRVMFDPRGLVWLPFFRRFVSWRGHTEAMAYAMNVALGQRDLEDVVESLTNPNYATGLNTETGTELVEQYIDKLQRITLHTDE